MQIIINNLSTSLPKGLKESFTLVLRKKEKKNYLLPGIYRFIALKNTLVKLVEKVLIIYIVGKAEVEILLL